MGQIVGIVSGKGGVGKTTLCARLAEALCADGKKVLCIDLDTGMKNLDLLLGMESRTVFDLGDVLDGYVPFEKAAVQHPDAAGLSLLSAAHDYRTKIEKEALRALCDEKKECFDFILLDAPAGLGDGFAAVVYAAERLIVTATPDLTSVRDAGRTADVVRQSGKKQIALVLNRVRPLLMEKGVSDNVDEIMDSVGLPLLGLIPEDEQIVIRAGGRNARKIASPADAAFRNTAARLSGRNMPAAQVWRRHLRKGR